MRRPIRPAPKKSSNAPLVIGAVVLGLGIGFVAFRRPSGGGPSPIVEAVGGPLRGDYIVEAVDIWTMDHWEPFTPARDVGKPARFGDRLFETAAGVQTYEIEEPGFVLLDRNRYRYSWEGGKLVLNGGGARMILRRA